MSIPDILKEHKPCYCSLKLSEGKKAQDIP